MANAEHKEKWLQHFNSRKMICVGPCWAQLCHVFKPTPPQRVPLVGHRDRLGHWGALAVALPAGGCWDPQERQSIHEGSRKGKMLGKLGRGKEGMEGSHSERGSGLSPEQQPELGAGGASTGQGHDSNTRDGSDILFTRKEPFSIPCFPEEKKSEQEKEKPSQAH